MLSLVVFPGVRGKNKAQNTIETPVFSAKGGYIYSVMSHMGYIRTEVYYLDPEGKLEMTFLGEIEDPEIDPLSYSVKKLSVSGNEVSESEYEAREKEAFVWKEAEGIALVYPSWDHDEALIYEDTEEIYDTFVAQGSTEDMLAYLLSGKA